ncbi:hypothetical protein LguiA_004719 [Lonicera macranthoides]
MAPIDYSGMCIYMPMNFYLSINQSQKAMPLAGIFGLEFELLVLCVYMDFAVF